MAKNAINLMLKSFFFYSQLLHDEALVAMKYFSSPVVPSSDPGQPSKPFRNFASVNESKESSKDSSACILLEIKGPAARIVHN